LNGRSAQTAATSIDTLDNGIRDAESEEDHTRERSPHKSLPSVCRPKDSTMSPIT
jgi:hypothetical protein